MTDDLPREPRAAPTALRFDPDAYAGYVAEFDLTDTQKRDLLEAVWGIVVSFVDLGFGFHPIQQVLPTGADQKPLPADSGAVLDSGPTVSINTASPLASRFNQRAAGKEES